MHPDEAFRHGANGVRTRYPTGPTRGSRRSSALTQAASKYHLQRGRLQMPECIRTIIRRFPLPKIRCEPFLRMSSKPEAQQDTHNHLRRDGRKPLAHGFLRGFALDVNAFFERFDIGRNRVAFVATNF